MKKSTLLAIALWLLVVMLWLISKPDFTIFKEEPLRAFAQFSAITGATFFYWEFILSSRIKFVEDFMGALDLAYRSHRLLGMLSGIFILLHLTTLILNAIPNTALIRLYLLPSQSLPYTAGVVSFYFMVTIIFSTVYISLPYHIWKILHQVTSFVILFGSYHILTISSDVSEFNGLRVYFIFMMILAAGAWIYKVFLYRLISYPYTYIVSEVLHQGTVTVLTMKAKGKVLSYVPGQFSFIQFPRFGTKLFAEAHPYSIIPGTAPDELRFAIKGLGGYTKTIVPKTAVGDTVLLSRAHGVFGKELLTSNKTPVFLAAGIGITPILSFLKGHSTQLKEKPVFLFHTTKTNGDDSFDVEIELLKRDIPTLVFVHIVTQLQGRVSLEEMLSTLPAPLDTYDYFACGTQSFIASVDEFRHSHKPLKKAFHTEEFDYKSL